MCRVLGHVLEPCFLQHTLLPYLSARLALKFDSLSDHPISEYQIHWEVPKIGPHPEMLTRTTAARNIPIALLQPPISFRQTLLCIWSIGVLKIPLPFVRNDE